MTSSTGWREIARISANRTFVPKPWPLSRIARRMLLLLSPGLQGRDRRVVLPSGLANRGADHDLEELVLAYARCPRCGDVLVGDLVGIPSYLIDERTQRIGMPCVIERSTALGMRRLTFSVENPRDQRCACLFDVSHATSPSIAQRDCRKSPYQLKSGGYLNGLPN